MLLFRKLSQRVKRDFEVMWEGALSLDQVEHTDQFMRRMTNDQRWKWNTSFKSGEFSQINLRPDDPTAFAVLYAISKLEGAKKSQEEFVAERGAWSGGSKISAGKANEGMGAAAWLTPLTERFNPKELRPWEKDYSIHNQAEIRVRGNLDFMKKHAAQLHSHYTRAFIFATANELSARALFKNTPEDWQPAIKVSL